MRRCNRHGRPAGSDKYSWSADEGEPRHKRVRRSAFHRRARGHDRQAGPTQVWCRAPPSSTPSAPGRGASRGPAWLNRDLPLGAPIEAGLGPPRTVAFPGCRFRPQRGAARISCRDLAGSRWGLVTISRLSDRWRCKAQPACAHCAGGCTDFGQGMQLKRANASPGVGCQSCDHLGFCAGCRSRWMA